MTTLWTGPYRLQMHKGFPLSAAARILPYLKKLGISHVYLSPCLQAAPGSTHGYDVADPTRINSELGGEGEWKAFTAQIRAQGLKVLLDIVPNHMSASRSNPWWEDVLSNGPYSRYADFFDIRMRENTPYRIEICSLGKPYGQAIDAGELRLVLQDGRPRVAYFDNSWPLSPRSWATMLESTADPDEARRADGFRELAALPDEPTSTEARRGYEELIKNA